MRPARMLALLVLVSAGLVRPAWSGAPLTVTRTDDPPPNGCAPGDCSVREAVIAANAAAGPDTIVLPAGTYTLSIPPDGTPEDGEDGDLDVVGELTVAGADASTTIIDGAQTDRMLHVDGGDVVNVSDVTIRNGLTDNVFGGGGLLNLGGDVTFTRVRIAGSQTTNGDGGGIANGNASANLTIVDSAITGNRATNLPAQGDGGGLHNINGGTVTLINVTVSANESHASGGGIANEGGGSTLTLVNATVTDNAADPDLDNGASTSAGGILSGGSVPVSLSNTIVAGNHDPDPTLSTDPDCDGPFTSMGHNLIGVISPACSLSPSTGDLIGTDPMLGALADNGGPTPTHALAPSSPAVNAGGSGCTSADQRGAPRASCDIGAYELVRCQGVTVNRVGTDGNDALAGTDGPEGVLGLGGNDVITTGAGDDAVCGGDGNDVVDLGPGNDIGFGEAGADRLLGSGGRDLLRGGAQNDRLAGGPQKDRLFGDAGKDRLNGGPGKDRCKGGPGKDRNRRCERGKP